jgi:hypothetical protein
LPRVSTPARVATLILLAIHLCAASAPCPTAALPERAPDHAALAGADSHPCPGHVPADAAASTWLDARCPCGCQSGAAPGNGVSRTGPALFVAGLAPLVRLAREALPPCPAQPADAAPAPPDHVPLAIA